MPTPVDPELQSYVPLEGTFDLAMDSYDQAPDRTVFNALAYVYDNDRAIEGRGSRPVNFDNVFNVVTVERWEDQQEYQSDTEIVDFKIPVETYISGYPVWLEAALRTPQDEANFLRDAPDWGARMGRREVGLVFRPLARNDMAYTGKAMFTPSVEPHNHPAGAGFFHNRYFPGEILGGGLDIFNLTPAQAHEMVQWAQIQLAANQVTVDDDEAVYGAADQNLLVIVSTRKLYEAFAPLEQRSMLIVENDQGNLVREENLLKDRVTVRYIPSFGGAIESRAVFVDLNSPFKPVVFIDDVPLHTGIFEDKNLPNGKGRAGARRLMGAGNLWPQSVLDVFDSLG